MNKAAPLQIRRNLPEQHTTGGNPSFSTVVEDEEGKPMEVRLAVERDPVFIENNLAVAIDQLAEAQRTLSHIRGAIHNPALAHAIEAAARELIHTIKSLQPLTGQAWTTKEAANPQIIELLHQAELYAKWIDSVEDNDPSVVERAMPHGANPRKFKSLIQEMKRMSVLGAMSHRVALRYLQGQ